MNCLTIGFIPTLSFQSVGYKIHTLEVSLGDTTILNPSVLILARPHNGTSYLIPPLLFLPNRIHYTPPQKTVPRGKPLQSAPDGDLVVRLDDSGIQGDFRY